MEYKIKRLRREKVFGGSALEFMQDLMELPDGKRETWDFVHHRRGGGACVVPVLDDGRILMIRQFRPAVGLGCWSFRPEPEIRKMRTAL